MKGQIIKISSDLYFVSSEDKVYPCKCRGIFRKEHITPVVGDYVLFSKDKKIIEKIEDRKNVFDRPKVSNIDQAFLITSLRLPDFSLILLDKFISLMEIHHVKPIICITKEDLLSEDELKPIYEVLQYYSDIGYMIVSNTEIDKIRDLLKDKTSVFTGQTGAGKSTLLNRINPNWNLEVGEVSQALGRGKHTSALELTGYSVDEIKNSFVEFSNYSCPFKDCSHTKERECVIKEEVSANHILESRYQSYLSFIGVDKNEKN